MLDINIIPDPHGSSSLWGKASDLAPHLLWAGLIVYILFVIGLDRIRDAFSRSTKIGFAGISIELRAGVEEAARARNIPLPPQLRDRVANRLNQHQHLLAGARFLWIDDNPSNNITEIGILHGLGVTIDLAITDDDARRCLNAAIYDLIISDMARAGDNEAGRKLLPILEAAVLRPPIIFYVGRLRNIPQGAFGLTNRPDEVFHLVLDALERRRN